MNELEDDARWPLERLANLTIKVGSGSTPRGGETSYKRSGIPLIRSMNVVFFGFKRDGLAFIDDDQASALENVTVRSGDVLLNITGASIGRVTMAPSDMEGARVNQHVCIIRPSQALDARYLNAYLSGPTMQHFIFGENYGVTRQALTKQQILDFQIPLAPLAEQKRIADKLESVLGRVDACRARLDRLPALLKRFRQSVLAAAVSGKLTENWRDTNPNTVSWKITTNEKKISLPQGYKRLSKQSFKTTTIDHQASELPNTWCVQTVHQLYDSNCLIDFADGNHGSLYPRKEEFGPEGALFLTATQMSNSGWRVDLDECPRLNWKKAKQLTKGWASNNDVLLSHNATVGRVGIVEGITEDVILGTSVTFYRFNPNFVVPRYARIVFSSRFFQDQLESVMEQTTRDQVPITKQVSLNFICAPVAEQQEIVRRVEALFAFADRIESRLATAQKSVERLTPATLAKAFRGELVPQDPNDEPASALLGSITATKEAAPAKSKPKTRRVAKR